MSTLKNASSTASKIAPETRIAIIETALATVVSQLQELRQELDSQPAMINVSPPKAKPVATLPAQRPQYTPGARPVGYATLADIWPEYGCPPGKNIRLDRLRWTLRGIAEEAGQLVIKVGYGRAASNAYPVEFLRDYFENSLGMIRLTA